jgi:hypothetical protein
MCIILFDDSSATLQNTFKPLLEYYKNDKITFVFVNKDEESELHQQLGGGNFHMVALKPKLNKFVGYNKADFSDVSIKDFVDNILGGGGDFAKFEGTELKLS